MITETATQVLPWAPLGRCLEEAHGGSDVGGSLVVPLEAVEAAGREFNQTGDAEGAPVDAGDTPDLGSKAALDAHGIAVLDLARTVRAVGTRLLDTSSASWTGEHTGTPSATGGGS